MSNTPFHILFGGIFALVNLVVVSLLDFFKREPRHRYDVYSRSESYRMFYLFFGISVASWILIALMQSGLIPGLAGWPAFMVLFIVKMVMFQKDFARRRMDVPNLMLRITQYEFVLCAVMLVTVSYFVHKKPERPTSSG